MHAISIKQFPLTCDDTYRYGLSNEMLMACIELSERPLLW